MTTDNGLPTAEPSDSDQSSIEVFTCPNCGLPNTTADTVCPRCGSTLIKGPDTLQMDFKSMVGEYAKQLRGDAFITNPNPVVFEIDGQQVNLPQGDSLIVGRRTYPADSEQPDVDLSRFSATQRGVSRTHMRLVRRGNLLYIVDLESRNGTWLNGKRLADKTERILRNGDQVQLGKLKIIVRF